MNIAIVHEYLIQQGGSENCVEALLELFPKAPVYTCYYHPKTLPDRWHEREVRSSFLQKLPLGGKNYQNRVQYALPLMPLAYESLDLRAFDLVISSCHAFSKGVLTRSNTLHLAYLHTPTRYLWDLNQEYQQDYRGKNPFKKTLMPLALHYLRMWDYQAAQRPQLMLANSRYVARRIERYYGRAATVIYPPVDVDYFQPVAQPTEDYYLLAGRWVPYKRGDLAIQVFKELGLRLLVVGDGPELAKLKAQAGPKTEFLPSQPRAQLKDLFAHCRALVFPGEEDFGILPVEVQASGRPVICFGRGGATETVQHGVTGIHFAEQSIDSLKQAVLACEAQTWDAVMIRRHSEQFSRAQFLGSMQRFIDQAWDEFSKRS